VIFSIVQRMWGTFQCHTKLYHTECAFHPPLQMGAFRHSLGKGANIEVKGDLGIIKKYGGPIIVTGIVNTVRGTYDTNSN